MSNSFAGQTDTDICKIDPELNMRRFYRMTVCETLFGEVDLVREYGRIGSAGRLMRNSCESMEAAARLQNAIEKEKRRRGYIDRC